MNPFLSMFDKWLKPGSVKWCKRCSREHAARADCGLVEVKRIAKSGREVVRLGRPKPLRKKRTVRKS